MRFFAESVQRYENDIEPCFLKSINGIVIEKDAVREKRGEYPISGCESYKFDGVLLPDKGLAAYDDEMV